MLTLLPFAFVFAGQVPQGIDIIGNRPLIIRDGGIAKGNSDVGSADVTVFKKGEFAYSAEVKTPKFNRALKSGEVVYITYQVRCSMAKNESETGYFNAYFQRGQSPYDGFGSTGSGVSKNWRVFHVVAKVDKDYETDQMEFTFHIGGVEQHLEIKDLSAKVFPVGTDTSKFPTTVLTYHGRETNAPWRAKAIAMIEKNRKGDLTVVVTKNGKPMPHAKVHVQMMKHAYVFGTYSEFHADKANPDSEKYRSYLTSKWFSRITVPIYWADWGWESPIERKMFLDTIAWATKNNLRMKAHNLLWPSDHNMPKRFTPLRGEELRTELRKSLTEQLAVLKGSNFENIDVINELKTEHDVPDRIGDDILGEYFKRTRATFPTADLVYNDYAIFEGTGAGGKNFDIAVDWVRKLKKVGAPITLSGWQAHFGEDLTDPAIVWKLIDRWKAETGLPLEITEFDINTRDEKTQADYTRDLLTAWFAHPDTKGFTMWGFWQTSHWIPNGAMFRADWSRKPNADVWEKLVTKDWWTDVTVDTDANGVAKVRGFLGDYKLTIDGKEKLVSLPKGGIATNFSE